MQIKFLGLVLIIALFVMVIYLLAYETSLYLTESHFKQLTQNQTLYNCDINAKIYPCIANSSPPNYLCEVYKPLPLYFFGVSGVSIENYTGSCKIVSSSTILNKTTLIVNNNSKS